jgi:hypothetical protein
MDKIEYRAVMKFFVKEGLTSNEIHSKVIIPARPRPTALLSPSSDSKPEAATAVVVAPDDGREDARNMLSCI